MLLAFVVCLVAAILLYALNRKGDVKARVSLPFCSFALEAKGKPRDSSEASQK
jgi:hypothetical protein